jgi:uncharacterized membrane protein YbhN (UPF0104 family)
LTQAARDDPRSRSSGGEGTAWRRASPWLARLLTLFAIALSGVLLYRTFGRYDLGALSEAVRRVPVGALLVAIGWAAASYLCLTLNDYLGLRHVGCPLPYPRVALAAFVALSIGHNVGIAMLSSGAIRYRFYARAGLGVEALAKLILFCGSTIVLGLSGLAAIVLLARPQAAGTMTGLGLPGVLTIGAVLVGVLAAYVALAARLRGTLRVFRWSFALPSGRMALAQIGLGTLNFACVAACLHALVSAIADVPYAAVVSAYVLATAAAVVTHAPGGLGVIESVVLGLLPEKGMIGAVLDFRFVYFLIPLALGLTLFAIAEARNGVLRLRPRALRLSGARHPS